MSRTSDPLGLNIENSGFLHKPGVDILVAFSKLRRYGN